jgi:hypothetical protein
MSVENFTDNAEGEFGFNCDVLISCLNTLNKKGPDGKGPRLSSEFVPVLNAVNEMKQSGGMNDLLDPAKRSEFPQEALFSVMPDNLWRLKTVDTLATTMKLVDKFVRRQKSLSQ